MQLPYTLDDGASRRATLGLIVLKTDETIESDFRTLLPSPDIRLHHSRIASMADVSGENLATMGDTMTASARLLPATAGLDVIGFGCTAASMVLGEETVDTLIRAAHPDVAVTNPLSALKAACRALGVGRIGLVSPYVESVSGALREAIDASGIEIARYGSFEQIEDSLVVRIAPDCVSESLVEIGDGDHCEAVFASCTNLRAVEVLAAAERRLGKPVLASNQVLAWHMLRLAGVEDAIPDAGVLFERPLAAADRPPVSRSGRRAAI